jgi:hypothetical protein
MKILKYALVPALLALFIMNPAYSKDTVSVLYFDNVSRIRNMPGCQKA